METEKRCKLHLTGDVKLTLTPTLKHYGRWDCTECGKFVVWAKSPKTCQDMHDRKEQVLHLLKDRVNLSFQDLKDLCDIYSAIHLNLVQNEKWMRFNSPLANFNGV